MLKIGQEYRVTQTPDKVTPILDNLPNFNYETAVPNYPISFAPRRGINNFKTIKDPDGKERMPVLIIHSGLKKGGRNYNPWHDEFHPERGTIKYFGDNKPHLKSESNNRYLLEQIQFNKMRKRKDRLHNSVPVICMVSTSPGTQVFQGYGIVERAEIVTQYSEEFDCYFNNYLFTICIFTMSEDGEHFDWKWIADRCNPSLTAEQANNNAPNAWKYWIDNGISKLHLVRRNVFASKVVSLDNQRPESGSETEKILNEIFKYYDGRKHDFEALALEVTKMVIEENGGRCTTGWTTKRSGDGGVDFVLRIDIGYEKLAGLQIIVLGQAKCEKPSGNVRGIDIARTVARLKRGWVGSFVSTQPFSEDTQNEVMEDNYPLLLINGTKVAETVIKALRESECSTLEEYLKSITEKYPRKNYLPEDIIN